MSLFRGLIFILAIWLAFVLARHLYRSSRRQRSVAQQAGKNSLAVTVVPCAQCGVHIPKSEALTADGRYFCSKTHRDVQS